MSLHDRILEEVDAFPFNTMSSHVSREHLDTYVEGFNRAKDQAAQIAKEADDLIEALADAVRRYESGQPAELQADHAINMYSRYKERTK